MTLKDLYTYVLENGGATYCPTSKSLFTPNQGFMVSESNMVRESNADAIVPLNELSPALFIEIVDCFELLHSQYVGIWIDDDKIYFDVSTHWTNLKFALIEGMTNKQKAIWDFQQNKAIVLPSDQRSGTTTQQLEYRKQVIEKMVANYPECKWY
jgi:hypothetical protein